MCPRCRGTDFDEVRQRTFDVEFLMINKSTVIDLVVSAIASINKKEPDTAKEYLVEFIPSHYRFIITIANIGLGHFGNPWDLK